MKSDKAKPGHVQKLYSIQKRLGKLRATGMTWRKIGGEFPGVPPATLCAIFKHGRDPKNPAIRASLGLPAIGQGRICPIHGKVCDHVHRPPRPKPPKPAPPERVEGPIGRVFDPARPLIGDWITE